MSSTPEHLDSYLSGRWVSGDSVETRLVDPVTGDELATVSAKGVDIDAALDHARRNGQRALRAMSYAERGKLVGAQATSIAVKGGNAVEIRLKQPFAPLLPLLASNGAAAAIMPKELTGGDQPISEFIGTGPYKLLERKVEQFTRLTRFDQYKSPSGDPDGYGGCRRQQA